MPFFGARRSCSAACSSELDRTWGVPCAWQLIANLPSACNSSFTPNVTALLESSNLAPNATAQSKRAHFYQVYDEGKKEAKQYDCNLHAFCSACSDGAGGVNAYCAATVMYYNSFILDAHVLMYADDFWCRADVLGSIARGSTRSSRTLESTSTGGTARTARRGFSRPGRARVQSEIQPHLKSSRAPGLSWCKPSGWVCPGSAAHALKFLSRCQLKHEDRLRTGCTAVVASAHARRRRRVLARALTRRSQRLSSSLTMAACS